MARKFLNPAAVEVIFLPEVPQTLFRSWDYELTFIDSQILRTSLGPYRRGGILWDHSSFFLE
jgi:hypothetical protein